MTRGSLTIVGTGITLIAHITIEAQAWITRADKTFFLVMHPLIEQWMLELNPAAESLARFYTPRRDRAEVYRDIADHVLAAVQGGHMVCAAFYGHPGVFVSPTQDMVERARAMGHEVKMLPGISAEDCLFADLGLDPGRQGCQSYEASDFVIRPRRFDPCTPLILWQAGVIGYFDVIDPSLDPSKGLAVLEALLRRSYPPDHPLTIYEAALLPTSDPVITQVRLDQLTHAPINAVSTLYVPPVGQPPVDAGVLEALERR